MRRADVRWPCSVPVFTGILGMSSWILKTRNPSWDSRALLARTHAPNPYPLLGRS